MSTQLNLLIIEDKPADFRLIVRHLEKHGLAARCHCVSDIKELEAAVEQGGWDAVLSDYSVPALDFQHTLGVLQARHPNVPLILVSGSVGEEEAVELLKLGVWDFVLKDSLTRLVPAIERSLQDAAERHKRKRTEAALRESEQWHRTILQTAMAGFWLVDMQGHLLEVNESYCRMSGYSAPELLARRVPDLEANDTADDVAARIQKIVAQGEDRFESRHRRKDGSLFEVEVSIQYQPTGDGRMVTFVQDITERKRAEEERDRLAMAVEQSAETIVITDARGTILYANPAFEKTSGYTRAEALGQNPRILKSGQHDAEFYRQMWTVLGRGDVWTGRFINRRKDGTLYEEAATISPVRDAVGKVVNYVAVKRDVTHEAQLEAQLRQSQKMEAIGQLSGGVAHDFNNILAIIMMQAELTGAVGNLPAEVREGLAYIRAAAERAANLTRQLLLFSRKQVMQPRELDLNDVITNLAKMLRRIIGEDLGLQLNLCPRPQITRADPGMLDQMLMNLVINARDAMPGGGRIIVETGEENFTKEEAALVPDAKPGRYVSLRVTDTGCGIAPENLSRIFEPFFTTKEPGKGTGLGLATVFGIVKQHGGSLTVESKVGRGTTFQIYLPATETVGQSAAAAAVKPKPRGGTETILLVEDEDAVRLLTRAVLERFGYRVLEAPDGVEALRIWEQNQDAIRLLLTDLVMPEGVSGLELAARLQARNPRLRVVFTSGYSADIAGRELSLQEGQNFIQKPSAPEQLLETVRQCLDRQ